MIQLLPYCWKVTIPTLFLTASLTNGDNSSKNAQRVKRSQQRIPFVWNLCQDLKRCAFERLVLLTTQRNSDFIHKPTFPSVWMCGDHIQKFFVWRQRKNQLPNNDVACEFLNVCLDWQRQSASLPADVVSCKEARATPNLRQTQTNKETESAKFRFSKQVSASETTMDFFR